MAVSLCRTAAAKASCLGFSRTLPAENVDFGVAKKSVRPRAHTRRGDLQMRFIDLDLARRIEMAEANAGRECAEACHRLHPEYPVAVQEIAGGIAVFAGVDSPVT